MTVNDSIAFSLSTSQYMLDAYLKDLKPEEWLHRICATGNCAAWLMGHLILTERRALQRLGASELPALPEGFDKRFARDESAQQATSFGDVTILTGLFERHRARLIEAVKALPAEQLDTPLDTPSPRFRTLGEMLLFMAIHTTTHAGQISAIRRSLGRPPLF